jgi:predicted transcriptional regulator
MTPKQREVYELLTGATLCVKDLMALLGKDRATVQGHVRALRYDGWIWSQSRSEWVGNKTATVTYYSAAAKERPIEDRPWVKVA